MEEEESEGEFDIAVSVHHYMVTKLPYVRLKKITNEEYSGGATTTLMVCLKSTQEYCEFTVHVKCKAIYFDFCNLRVICSA